MAGPNPTSNTPLSKMLNFSTNHLQYNSVFGYFYHHYRSTFKLLLIKFLFIYFGDSFDFGAMCYFAVLYVFVYNVAFQWGCAMQM